MKILHVITGLRKAAGTSVFVGELASEQATDGHTVAIFVKNRCEDDYPVSDKVEIYSTISYLSLLASHSYDIVHVHALWDPWLTKVARCARRAGAKIVWSPHGMLTPWALKNKWPKKLAGLLAYQYWSLRAADLIHVTADTEAADVRRLHLGNKLVLAPLGVHVSQSKPRAEVEDQNCASLVDAVSSPRQSKPQVEPSEDKYICFVSRIQRKKGLPNLLRAWAQLPADLKRGWQIKVAGPDEDNHLAELYALCEELKIPYTPAPVDTTSSSRQKTEPTFSVPQSNNPTIQQSNNSQILFLGPVYDAAKDALYANAAFSVLPTHSENFGSVVIESLAQGTPVICTKGAPWRDLVDSNCGWWIDIGVAPLVTALTEALDLANSEHSTLNFELPTLNSKLRSMGANGQRLVREKYSWSAVCRAVLAGYKDMGVTTPTYRANCKIGGRFELTCEQDI